MTKSLREIRFSQTHRRTGTRRRFIIAQFEDAASQAPQSYLETELYSAPVGAPVWYYKVQIGDAGAWSAFRPLEVALDASDAEVRKIAAQHLAKPARDRGERL
jgi:hypothetical protein